MLRKVSSEFEMEFERSGGSIIAARVDVWKADENQWRQITEVEFADPLQSSEQIQARLPVGQYTCVFQCYVEESLNGRYDFKFSVAGKPTFVDSGDVNTTSAPNDSKVYKDQFILEVR